MIGDLGYALTHGVLGSVTFAVFWLSFIAWVLYVGYEPDGERGSDSSRSLLPGKVEPRSPSDCRKSPLLGTQGDPLGFGYRTRGAARQSTSLVRILPRPPFDWEREGWA